MYESSLLGLLLRVCNRSTQSEMRICHLPTLELPKFVVPCSILLSANHPSLPRQKQHYILQVHVRRFCYATCHNTDAEPCVSSHTAELSLYLILSVYPQNSIVKSL